MNTGAFISTGPGGIWKEAVTCCRFKAGGICVRRTEHLVRRRLATRCMRMSRTQQNSEGRAERVIDGPFEGHYGQWNLTQGDVDGVTIYRSALAVCAGCVVFGVGTYLSGADFAPRIWDGLFFGASCSFGVALQTIHIYLKPMHNLIKGFWAVGLICSAVLASSPLLSTGGMVTEVLQRPELMLAIGWQFVSLTGLFFKEAVCFGRTEAVALGLLAPVLSGGHFLRVLPAQAEEAGALAFSVLFVLFSVRKFMQNPRDDLGDKSVFDHLEQGGTLG